VSQLLHVSPAFSWNRNVGGPGTKRRAFAFAGIAKPEQFFDELTRAGWDVAGHRSFSDHYQYSTRDIAQVARDARQINAEALVTTSKDFVRLLPEHHTAADQIPIVEVPLQVAIDPAFGSWLRGHLSRVGRRPST
jgi:tetraacyldisaccharide 4'-kinase